MRSPSTLKQHAYESILGRLKSGEFAPGMRLSDELLVGELGVSRSPVREAILQLSGEGIIEQRPRQGAYIRMPDRKSLANEFELRLALEPFAAGLAAERRTNADMKKLRNLTRRMEKITNKARGLDQEISDPVLRLQFLECDDSSHDLIAKMVDNERISDVTRVGQLVMRIFALAVFKPGSCAILESYLQHQQFVDAIEDRDVSCAREAMTCHIESGAKNLLKIYDSLADEGKFSQQ